MLEKKILSLFSIRKHEKQLVSLSASYSFIDGFLYEYVTVIPLALFLGRSEITTLPYVYILTALFFLLTIFIFNFFEKRVVLFKLTASTVVVLAISSIFFWVILKTTKLEYTPMALLVWSWIVTCFLSMISDYLFSSIIILEQAKRLYGPLGAAYGIGAILGAASIPLLIKFTATENILLLIPVFFALSLMLQFRIKKNYSKQLNAVHKDTEQTEAYGPGEFKFLNLFKRKYVLFVLLVGILVSFEYYTLEMLFNKQVQDYFIEEEQITKFLGYFYTVINITSLLISAFVFSRFLEKYGTITALFVMPISTLVIMTFAFIFNFIPATMFLVFWMIALIRLIESLMNISVNEQGIILLFQPLKARERIWALTQHNFSAFVFAMGCIGVLLLIMTKVFGVNFIVFGIALVIFCLYQIYLLYRLRSGYLQELMKALNKHFLVQSRFPMIDEESLVVLRKGLQSSYPDEVIYALKHMEKVHFPEFQKELVNMLDHPSQNVKDFAFSNIENYKLQTAYPKVLDICKTNPSEKAIVTLAACSKHKAYTFLENWLSSDNLMIRSGAILGLLKYGTKSLSFKAENALQELKSSRDPYHKQKAMGIYGQLKKTDSHVSMSLLPFLQDDHLEVRKSACIAATHFQEPLFYEPLISNLSIPAITNEALAALIAQKPKSFLFFTKKNFKKYPEVTQELIIKVLENMQYSQDFLQNILESSKRKIFHAALLALAHKHSSLDPIKVNTYLSKEVIYLKQLGEKVDLLSGNPQNELVHSFLLREMELSLQRIFKLLSFIYPKGILSHAEHGFFLHKEDVSSYAMELLLCILSSAHTKQLSKIMIDTQHRIMRMDVEDAKNPDEIKGLSLLMNEEEDYIIYAIPTAAMYIAFLYHKSLHKLVEAKTHKKSDDALFQETALHIKKSIKPHSSY